nr:unnamed protein product [Digitaria exilis]
MATREGRADALAFLALDTYPAPTSPALRDSSSDTFTLMNDVHFDSPDGDGVDGAPLPQLRPAFITSAAYLQRKAGAAAVADAHAERLPLPATATSTMLPWCVAPLRRFAADHGSVARHADTDPAPSDPSHLLGTVAAELGHQ